MRSHTKTIRLSEHYIVCVPDVNIVKNLCHYQHSIKRNSILLDTEAVGRLPSWNGGHGRFWAWTYNALSPVYHFISSVDSRRLPPYIHIMLIYVMISSRNGRVVINNHFYESKMNRFKFLEVKMKKLFRTWTATHSKTKI